MFLWFLAINSASTVIIENDTHLRKRNIHIILRCLNIQNIKPLSHPFTYKRTYSLFGHALRTALFILTFLLLAACSHNDSKAHQQKPRKRTDNSFHNKIQMNILPANLQQIIQNKSEISIFHFSIFHSHPRLLTLDSRHLPSAFIHLTSYIFLQPSAISLHSPVPVALLLSLL